MHPIVQQFFLNVPEQLPEELITTLVESEQYRLERIISKGHTTPSGYWYDQSWNEWVLLLRGQAILRIADSENLIEMKAGDYLWIPAGIKHRVEWTPTDIETFWLAAHFKSPTLNK